MKAKLIKLTLYDGYRLDDENGLLMASTLESSKNKLSFKNCQVIERGYDVNELVYNQYLLPKSTFIEMTKCSQNPYLLTEQFGEDAVSKYYEIEGFKIGFQKALELLGDKKFSEEDLKYMFEFGFNLNNPISKNEYNTRVQSLQQTEWDVSFNPDEKDSEGCLVLKRL